MMTPLLIQGMHGLGDNLHQRAIISTLSKRHDVWLETSWPQVYHDMPVHCVAKGTTLRTQLKNVERSRHMFERSRRAGPSVRIWYTPQQVRAKGSVLAAMCAEVGVDHETADFRMPVPSEWVDLARSFVRTDRPLLIYRPLVERTEWGGCAARNPDPNAYAALFAAIRERYFVVSIADLVPGVEWMTSLPIQADREFHAGELHFEALAGLFSIASLVWASPGFAVPLAQAVETPVVCIFGGYESSRSFTSGARFSRYLGIDPKHPCECFQHRHRCRKEIDVVAAARRIEEFVACR